MGNQDNVLYLAAEGKAGKSNNGWLLGVGGGYRKVINNRILGGYLLFDYNNSPSHHKFWIANPGIESLGKVWDFRVNGYIPISNRNWVKHQTRQDWEDNVGMYNDEHFSGNTETDHKVDITQYSREEINSGIGVDAEIGRTIPIVKGLKAYVGGYHFDTKDIGDINGASGRVTYQVNNYVGIEAIDTYDNHKKNTAMLGIKISLGGFNKEEPLIGFTPIDYKAINSKTGVVDQYPILVFAPGKYDLSAFSKNGRFALPNGWSMYGRTADYKAPAMGGQRPELDGGIDLIYEPGHGETKTTLNSLRIVNTESSSQVAENATLRAINAKDVVLQNTDIKNNVGVSGKGVVGIYMRNSTLNFERLSAAEDGENSVDAYNVNEFGEDGEYAAGIYSDLNSNSGDNNKIINIINFNGGENDINVVDHYWGIAEGIYADYSKGPMLSTGNFTNIINFNDGENHINVNGDNGSDGIYVSFGVGFPLYAINSKFINTINFTGGENEINSFSNEEEATESCGIKVKFGVPESNNNSFINTINFTGGDNYISGISKKNSGFGIYTPILYSTSYQNTFKNTIEFVDGNNNIIGKGVGGAGIYTDISASSSTSTSGNLINNLIEFRGGKNNIKGEGGDGIRSELSLAFDDSSNSIITTTINFKGGENTISGESSYNSVNGMDISSSGTDKNHPTTTINFSGGENVISANGSSNDNTLPSVGINIVTSTGTIIINFLNNSDNKIKIEANGYERHGIFVQGPDTNTSIKDKYGQDMTKDTIKNYVRFISKSSDDSKGFAVSWHNRSNQYWRNLWNQ